MVTEKLSINEKVTVSRDLRFRIELREAMTELPTPIAEVLLRDPRERARPRLRGDDPNRC